MQSVLTWLLETLFGFHQVTPGVYIASRLYIHPSVSPELPVLIPELAAKTTSLGYLGQYISGRWRFAFVS